MIPFDFVYCRPDTLREAADAFKRYQGKNKKAVCYGGGSEIITMCRAGSIHPDAVVDIKGIPECGILEKDDCFLTIGAACTLSRITESKLFPLLGLACGRVADHTNQCRITLGGNLCGTVIYRETGLPLLLSDAEVTVGGPDGMRRVPFQNIFDGRVRLREGEWIVQAHIPVWALQARHAHIKKTAQEKIDYPLVNVTAIWKEDVLRAAFSGICSRPFRSRRVEAVLNDRGLPPEIRAEKAAGLLPEPPYHDVEGSGEYRAFVFKNTLCELLEAWQNDRVRGKNGSIAPCKREFS